MLQNIIIKKFIQIARKKDIKKIVLNTTENIDRILNECYGNCRTSDSAKENQYETFIIKGIKPKNS